MAGDRIVHCWEDGPKRHEDDGTFYGRDFGSTCMLLEGHDGPHRWTPDDRIGVRFLGPADSAEGEKTSAPAHPLTSGDRNE